MPKIPDDSGQETPFGTQIHAGGSTAAKAMPEIDRQVFEARELIQARRYELARPLLAKALSAKEKATPP